MLVVDIKVNNRKVATVRAVNVSEKHGIPYGSGTQVYRVEGTDHLVAHVFEDGPVQLASIICGHKWYEDYKKKKK